MAGPLSSEAPLPLPEEPELAEAAPLAEQPAAAEEEAAAPLGKEEGGALRGRFRLVYLTLAILLAGAIASLILLVARPGAGEGPSWSDWRPAGTGLEVAQEIADYVSGGYQQPTGRQLVAVQATRPRVRDLPIGAIVVRPPPATGLGEEEGDFTVIPGDDSLVYVLCGLGENCAIVEGTPTVERHRLLRRESLELALYTFRYVSGIDSVVAFLPPKSGEDATTALLFRRGDFRAELKMPLRTTLPMAAPPLAHEIPSGEVATIDRLTGPRLFSFEFQQLEDGTAVLVLDPPIEE